MCNQIIHSFVWQLSATEDEGTFDGVFVCSDRSRRKILYHFHVDTLIDLFRRVGAEDIYSIHMRRDEKGEMRIVNVLGRPFDE
ncbi:hypothetical protein [Streptomyces lydicus]|uniref:hypothetical protein n=1 Tax=Streptomyces lydicus TaxID=47763 RepID=UPI00379F4AE4